MAVELRDSLTTAFGVDYSKFGRRGQEMALRSMAADRCTIAYLSDPEIEPSRILEIEEGERNKTAGLQSALQSLDARSRRIIEARWLREDDSTSTLQDLADEYGVSAERIRQIEAKAMSKLRHPANLNSAQSLLGA